MIDPAVKAHIQKEGLKFLRLIEGYKNNLPDSYYCIMTSHLEDYLSDFSFDYWVEKEEGIKKEILEKKADPGGPLKLVK